MAYSTNIPQAGSKLSVSQPQIQGNFLTANTVINVDHFPFDNVTSDQGKHRWVEMPVLAVPLPAGGTQGIIYTKSVTLSATSQTQLYYTQDGLGQEWQITSANNVNFATFGTFTNYPVPSVTPPYPPSDPAVPNQNGGWTFLPGGLLFQYGTMIATSSTQLIKFPVRFSAIPVVTATIIKSGSSTPFWGINNLTPASFEFKSTISLPFTWQATGSQ